MMDYRERERFLRERHEACIGRRNVPVEDNGVFERYLHPVVTPEHAPLEWRYDFDPRTNPFLMERFGIHATFNAGAIKLDGRYCLLVRVEGADRKSFFAVAESPNGVDNFRFWPRPITMPEWGEPATNVYDMRLTRHEDGWIYGLFCVERKDPSAAPGDLSSAVAACGIARTHDLVDWERLPDLKSASQQRNVVLHPEFVKGKYALYTRPQDGFIDAGTVQCLESSELAELAADLAAEALCCVYVSVSVLKGDRRASELHACLAGFALVGVNLDRLTALYFLKERAGSSGDDDRGFLCLEFFLNG